MHACARVHACAGAGQLHAPKSSSTAASTFFLEIDGHGRPLVDGAFPRGDLHVLHSDGDGSVSRLGRRAVGRHKGGGGVRAIVLAERDGRFFLAAGRERPAEVVVAAEGGRRGVAGRRAPLCRRECKKGKKREIALRTSTPHIYTHTKA